MGITCFPIPTVKSFLSYLVYPLIVVTVMVFIQMAVIRKNLKSALGAADVEHYSLACQFDGNLVVTGDKPPEEYDYNTASYLIDLQSRFYDYLDSGNLQSLSARTDTRLLRVIRSRTSPRPSALVFMNTAVNALIILFRGTDGKKEWRLDMRVNGAYPSIGGVVMSQSSKQALTKWMGFKSKADEDKDEVLVHSGFQDHYKGIRKELFKTIAFAPAKFIYAFGHSLGGGAANLFAYDILQRGTFPCQMMHVLTIGGPRTGNPAFCEWLTKKKATIIRLHNTADVFCALPFSSMPSLDVWGSLTTYQHAGKGYMFNKIGRNLLESHCLPMYKKAVEANNFTMYSECETLHELQKRSFRSV